MWHLSEPGSRWRLELDGIAFPIINMKEIPTSITRAPMMWHDISGEEVDTFLLAGLIGMKLVDDTGTRVQPSSGWWVLTGDPASYVRYMASKSDKNGRIQRISYRDVPSSPPRKSQ